MYDRLYIFFDKGRFYYRLQNVYIEMIQSNRATPGLCIKHTAEEVQEHNRKERLISLLLVTYDYNKTPMVMEAIEDADHADTYDGKKYPSPPAPVANILLYIGRGVPISEE